MDNKLTAEQKTAIKALVFPIIYSENEGDERDSYDNLFKYLESLSPSPYISEQRVDDENVRCECGHDVPEKFAVENDGQHVCMPCHIELCQTTEPGEYLPLSEQKPDGLKELSEITDEDAEQVGRMSGLLSSNVSYDTTDYIVHGKHYITNSDIEAIPIKVYQYLQSKNYKLPVYFSSPISESKEREAKQADNFGGLSVSIIENNIACQDGKALLMLSSNDYKIYKNKLSESKNSYKGEEERKGDGNEK